MRQKVTLYYDKGIKITKTTLNDVDAFFIRNNEATSEESEIEIWTKCGNQFFVCINDWSKEPKAFENTYEWLDKFVFEQFRCNHGKYSFMGWTDNAEDVIEFSVWLKSSSEHFNTTF